MRFLKCLDGPPCLWNCFLHLSRSRIRRATTFQVTSHGSCSVYIERSWSSFKRKKKMFHSTVVGLQGLRSIGAWLCRHSSLSNPLLCGLSLSLSRRLPLIPHSAPRDTPLLKEKVFRTVCSFITSLLHSRSLGLSEEDRTWFSLLNKSIFISLSSAWCRQCKQSHATSQGAPCHQHLPIKLNYSVLKMIFIHR